MSDTSNGSLIERLKARYAAKRGASRTTASKQYALIIIGISALFAGYRLMHHRAEDSFPVIIQPGVMPQCDSSTTRRLFSSALDEAPAAKQAGAKVEKLGAFRETGFVPVNSKGSEMRLCTADVFLNVGRYDVPFTLEWTSAAKDELWIEAEAPF